MSARHSPQSPRRPWRREWLSGQESGPVLRCLGRYRRQREKGGSPSLGGWCVGLHARCREPERGRGHVRASTGQAVKAIMRDVFQFPRGRQVVGCAEGLPRGLPPTLPSARLAAFPDPLGSGAGARSSGVEQPTFKWEPRRETSGWKGVKFGEPLRWQGNPEPSPSNRGRCRD